DHGGHPAMNDQNPSKNFFPLEQRFPRLLRRVGVLAGVLLALLVPSGRAAERPARGKVDYNFHIRPLLADRCYACHGPDEKKRKAGLRLDTRDGALAAGVLVPGKPEESELIQRISATDEQRMPPRKSNLRLNKQEIELIRRWVAEGAEYKPHLAFLPLPDVVPIPPVSD